MPSGMGNGGEYTGALYGACGEEGAGDILGSDSDTASCRSRERSGASESDNDRIDCRSSPSSVSISLLFEEEA